MAQPSQPAQPDVVQRHLGDASFQTPADWLPTPLLTLVKPGCDLSESVTATTFRVPADVPFDFILDGLVASWSDEAFTFELEKRRVFEIEGTEVSLLATRWDQQQDTTPTHQYHFVARLEQRLHVVTVTSRDRDALEEIFARVVASVRITAPPSGGRR